METLAFWIFSKHADISLILILLKTLVMVTEFSIKPKLHPIFYYGLKTKLWFASFILHTTSTIEFYFS